MTGRNKDLTMNISNSSEAAESLVSRLIVAKAAEAAANRARVDIEEEIISLLGAREEGSETHALASGYKITITGKLSYSVASADFQKFLIVCDKLPPEVRPIKTVVSLDETGAKFLRATNPKIWRCLGELITTKASKTSVSVKV